jgi:hypothetical protein
MLGLGLGLGLGVGLGLRLGWGSGQWGDDTRDALWVGRVYEEGGTE